jgi:hypothetical protein
MKSETLKNDMKPELCYIDREALREVEANLQYGKEHLQVIYDLFVKAAGSPPTMDGIGGWYGVNRDDFLVPKNNVITEQIRLKLYYDQRAKYPGLQFTIDNVTMPDLEELFEACGEIIFVPTVKSRERFFWNCYQIVGDKVEFIPHAVERVKNEFRAYAETPEEFARLRTVQQLAEVMNKIKISNPFQLVIPGFVTYDHEAARYVPVQHYVKGIIN